MLWLVQYCYLQNIALSQKRRKLLQLQAEQPCQSAELSLSTWAAANQSLKYQYFQFGQWSASESLETIVSMISWVDSW